MLPSVVLEDTSEPFLALDRAIHVGLFARRFYQLVAPTLVIALQVPIDNRPLRRVPTTARTSSSVISGRLSGIASDTMASGVPVEDLGERTVDRAGVLEVKPRGLCLESGRDTSTAGRRRAGARS